MHHVFSTFNAEMGKDGAAQDIRTVRPGIHTS